MLQIAFWFSFIDADEDVVNDAATARNWSSSYQMS